MASFAPRHPRKDNKHETDSRAAPSNRHFAVAESRKCAQLGNMPLTHVRVVTHKDGALPCGTDSLLLSRLGLTAMFDLDAASATFQETRVRLKVLDNGVFAQFVAGSPRQFTTWIAVARLKPLSSTRLELRVSRC